MHAPAMMFYSVLAYFSMQGTGKLQYTYCTFAARQLVQAPRTLPFVTIPKAVPQSQHLP